MAVKISEVKIIPQQTTVGQTITITVTAVDVSWGIIKKDFLSWNDIKSKLSNWKSVMNYH